MDKKQRNELLEKVLGKESAFVNPYTFIPFPDKAPDRAKPSPLTIDEDPAERGRFSGLLELSITTQSPLMTLDPTPIAAAEDERGRRQQGRGQDREARHK